MTILYRSNRMPSKGAILITNPRRKKPMLRRRKNAIKLRTNSAKDRFVADHLFQYYSTGRKKEALDLVKALKKTSKGGSYEAYQAAFIEAGGQKAYDASREKRRKDGHAFKSGKSGWGKALKLKPGAYRSLASLRTAAKKSKEKGATAKGRADLKAFLSQHKITAKPKASAPRSGAKRKGSRKLSPWQQYVKDHKGQGIPMVELADMARKEGILKSNPHCKNPKRRKNYRVKGRKSPVVGKNFWFDFLNQEKKRQTCKTKKELRRKYYYSFLPKALAVQVKSGRISAADRRAVLAKLQAKAKKDGIHPAKRKTAKRKASAAKKGASISAKRTAKRRTTSKRKGAKRKLSAWNRFVKKQSGKGLSLAKIADMARKQGIIGKAAAKKGKAVASKKRKSSKGKASAWTKFQKKFGGRGLTATQMKRLYRKSAGEQKVVLQRLAKIRKRKGESKKKAVARYRDRAGGMLYTPKRTKSGAKDKRYIGSGGKRGEIYGPFLARLNPRHGGLVSFAVKQYDALGKAVSKIPVVGFLGSYVAPVLTVGSVGYGLYAVGKKFGPGFVAGVPQVAAKIPLVGQYVAPVAGYISDKFAYTSLAVISGAALAAASKLPVADKVISMQGAKYVAGIAFAAGLAWDIKDMLVGGGLAASPFAGASYSGAHSAGGLTRAQTAALRAGPHAVQALAQRSPQGRSLDALISIMGFSKAQKLAYMSPAAQRRSLLALKARLGQMRGPSQSLPSQGQPALSVSSPLMGAANTFGGAQGLGYGALMYAGKGY